MYRRVDQRVFLRIGHHVPTPSLVDHFQRRGVIKLASTVMLPEIGQRRNRGFACRRGGKADMLKQLRQKQPDTPVARLKFLLKHVVGRAHQGVRLFQRLFLALTRKPGQNFSAHLIFE